MPIVPVLCLFEDVHQFGGAVFDESTVRRLLAAPVAKRTELFLYEIFRPWIFGYWAFLQPHRDGIELADMLIFFNDFVLLFEAKTREADGMRADERWIRSKITDGIEQINDRVQRLRSGAVDQISNAWRGVLPWDPTVVKDYYGLVVLNHASEPYDPREIAPDAFRASQIPIQVYSLQDLMDLVRRVNTPHDLVVYYELRNEFGFHHRMNVQEEVATFHAVLDSMVELMDRGGQGGTRGERRDAQRYWQVLDRVVSRRNPSSTEIGRIAASYLIDLACGGAQERANTDAEGRPLGGPEHDLRIRGLGALAEMSRLRRSVWGRRWIELAKSALRTNTYRETVGHSPKRQRAYVFAASDADPEDRRYLVTEALRRGMERNRATTGLGLVASPQRVLWTYDALRNWITGRSEANLGEGRILDADLIFIEAGTQ